MSDFYAEPCDCFARPRDGKYRTTGCQSGFASGPHDNHRDVLGAIFDTHDPGCKEEARWFLAHLENMAQRTREFIAGTVPTIHPEFYEPEDES